MSRLGNFDSSEFKKFADSLNRTLDERVIERWIKEFLKEMALRALRKIKKRTPVGKYGTYQYTYKSGAKRGQTVTKSRKGAHGRTGGNLRRNWKVGTVQKRGNKYVVEIYNNTEYGSFVEFGHRKRGGKGWVSGRFMMTISMKEIEQQLPSFMQKKQMELLNQIMSGRPPRW